MAQLADIMEAAAKIDDKDQRAEYFRHEIRQLNSVISAINHVLDTYSDSKNPDDLTEKETSLLITGKWLVAIKEIRARTGCGLAAAKEVTDSYRRRNHLL